MRVRKLARDLGCAEEDLLGLIHRLGYPRYTTAEQQLPDEVIERVRRHAPELARRPPAAPLARPGPVRTLDTPADDETRRLLEKELGGVRPLGRPAASPTRIAAVRAPARAVPAPTRTASSAPASPKDPPTASAAPSPVGSPSAAPPSSAVSSPAPPAAVSAELDRLRAALAAAEARVAVLEAGRPSPDTPADGLRAALAARGLHGDDEVAFFLAAVAAAHRSAELVDLLRADPRLPAWLAERVLLVGPGEEVPAGLVGVPVPAARSEGPSSPAVRAALTRLSTALLVHGKRRVAVIGGPPAGLRVLRDGLDRRIELLVAVGSVPGAFVLVWGEGTVPGARGVAARDVVGFSAEVIALLESAPRA